VLTRFSVDNWWPAAGQRRSGRWESSRSRLRHESTSAGLLFRIELELW